MPELPDVEARAKRLRRWTCGHRIVGVTPPDGKRQRAQLSAAEFIRRVRGKTVRSVNRKGKWILVELSGDAGIGIHLGMTGDLEHDRRPEGGRFAHAHFQLDDRSWVHYVDPRRFGKMIAARRYSDLLAHPAIAEVGPDALSELSVVQLREALAHSSRKIKEVLMDQHAMSGIGNVYATEALWIAKIHPSLRADRASQNPAQVRNLHRAIRSALKRGLKSYDRKKDFKPSVYGRAGLACPRCGTEIRSTVVGARTSAFCPRCQKRPTAPP